MCQCSLKTGNNVYIRVYVCVFTVQLLEVGAETVMKALPWSYGVVYVIWWLYFPLQELMEYICQLEQKMGTVSSAEWGTAPIVSAGE